MIHRGLLVFLVFYGLLGMSRWRGSEVFPVMAWDMFCVVSHNVVVHDVVIHRLGEEQFPEAVLARDLPDVWKRVTTATNRKLLGRLAAAVEAGDHASIDHLQTMVEANVLGASGEFSLERIECHPLKYLRSGEVKARRIIARFPDPGVQRSR